MPEYTYRKDKKLKHKDAIDAIFSQGESFYAYPLRVKFLLNKDMQIGVAVPKRLIPKATRRNALKRRMRESYRLLQYDLDFPIHAMFMYSSKKEESSDKIKKALKLLIEQINSFKAE